jgi:hypothetical protein
LKTKPFSNPQIKNGQGRSEKSIQKKQRMVESFNPKTSNTLDKQRNKKKNMLVSRKDNSQKARIDSKLDKRIKPEIQPGFKAKEERTRNENHPQATGLTRKKLSGPILNE